MTFTPMSLSRDSIPKRRVLGISRSLKIPVDCFFLKGGREVVAGAAGPGQLRQLLGEVFATETATRVNLAALTVRQYRSKALGGQRVHAARHASPDGRD